MTVIILRGAFNLLVIVTAADASGGEIIAPNKKQIAQGIEGINHLAVIATIQTVKSTNPTAKRLIERIFALKSRNDVKNAAEKRIGGKNKLNTRSGCNLISGKPGIKLIIKLQNNSTISTGSFNFGANVAAMAMHKKSTKNISIEFMLNDDVHI
jgi:hypothetical protein